MNATLARNEFTFYHPLRVRWAEVDPQGIVFNGHYRGWTLSYSPVAPEPAFAQNKA